MTRRFVVVLALVPPSIAADLRSQRNRRGQRRLTGEATLGDTPARSRSDTLRPPHQAPAAPRPDG